MIFLDSASTTRPKFFRKDYEDYWFNSNMPYAFEEQAKLSEAREKIKKCLGVKNGIVLFFRNATDAVQWLSSTIGIGICSKHEHDSVYNVIDFESENYSFACQYVNQITGVISSIEDFVCDALFMSDFTAAIGHVALPPNLENICDAVWFSGHKFHTEKGIGCMWLGKRICEILQPSTSPRNQYNLVHGTEDVAGAMMLADAMEHACSDIDKKEAEWRMLSKILLRDLREAGLEARYIYDSAERTHAINALYIKDVNADALATYLASKHIYVGVGHSACADNNDYRVLEYYGLNKEEASKVIRVSFDECTTIKDIKGLVENIILFYSTFVKENEND